MPVFTRGSFNINLGFASIGGEIQEQDRQCAWELYCELITRVAVTGKSGTQDKLDFSGEVYAESLESLYRFFQEARRIMRRYPVGSIQVGSKPQNHLGIFIARTLEVVIRPFLEKWQARYRYWWDHESNRNLPPFQRQAQFALLAELQADWAAVRQFCSDTSKEIAQEYKLVDVTETIPEGLTHQWIKEIKQVTKDA